MKRRRNLEQSKLIEIYFLVVIVYAVRFLCFLHMAFWMCIGNIVSFYSKCWSCCLRCRQISSEKERNSERKEDIADKMCNLNEDTNRFLPTVIILYLLPFLVVVIRCSREKCIFFHLLDAWHSQRIKDSTNNEVRDNEQKEYIQHFFRGNAYLGNIHQGDLLK